MLEARSPDAQTLSNFFPGLKKTSRYAALAGYTTLSAFAFPAQAAAQSCQDLQREINALDKRMTEKQKALSGDELDMCLIYRLAAEHDTELAKIKRRSEHKCNWTMTAATHEKAARASTQSAGNCTPKAPKRQAPPPAPSESQQGTSGTINCSSATLGDKKHCISVIRLNDMSYRFSINNGFGCEGQIFAAAIAETDPQSFGGQCSRKVHIIRRGTGEDYLQGGPGLPAPRVLDAISSPGGPIGLKIQEC
jgi:hypothetical protein